MPKLKHLEHPSGAVTLAFQPDKQQGPALLALGTVAGAVDVNFNSSSTLEIVALDWAAPAETLPVVGSVQAPERFNRLAWGHRYAAEPSFPSNGLLAGGLADGSVGLWDPAVILRGEGRNPLLQRMPKHKGPVRGLEFNPFSSNLLVSGAADSDLTIWDLIKPTAPALYPGVQVTPGNAANEITHISWNRKVQHILASCHTDGTTVVWDLKKNKPVISFRDPNSQRRASVLQWNPEVATQLVVASDDDRSPTLQMWDLRNSSAPLKEFIGHSKGVLGMAWCPYDPTLLLSCGKDSRNICWDVHSTDIVCELPSSHSWNFDIQWAPHSRGVFATSCFDGEVGLHNLLNCTISKIEQTVNADFSVSHTVSGDSVPLKRVPAWLKRPVCASFGFGGKLVTVTNNKVGGVDATGHATQRDQGIIAIKQVVTDDDLVQQSENFEEAIANNQKSSLQHYCSNKAHVETAKDPEEAETWAFLALLFESDARRELLKKLGFEDVMAHAPTPRASAGADANGQDVLGQEGAGMPNGTSQGGADGFQDDDPDFFDKLPDEGIMAAPPAKSPTATMGGGGLDEHGILTHRSSHLAGEGTIESSQELEDDIQRAIIAGNYDAAVESCFKANRLADALLIANLFNSELYQKAMHRYMKLCPKPYMSILRANLDHDWEALVRSRPTGKWKETLALLATYTQQDEWKKMCELLASRLSGAGMHHAALLCNICSGNLDNAVSYWIKSTGTASGTDKLQGVIEKSVIMGIVTNSNQGSAALSELVTSYAALLAAQGRMATAFKYLSYAPGDASIVLKDRIFRSGAAPLDPRERPPPFPFQQEVVKAQPITHATHQAANPYAANAGHNAGYRPAPVNTGYGDAYSQYGHAAAATHAHAGWGAQPANTWQQPAAPPPPPAAAPAPVQKSYQPPTPPAPPAQPAWNAYQAQPPQPPATTYGTSAYANVAQPAYGYQPAAPAYRTQAEPAGPPAPTFKPVSTHTGQDIAAKAHQAHQMAAHNYQPAAPVAPPPPPPTGPAVGVDHSQAAPYVAKRAGQPPTPTGQQGMMGAGSGFAQPSVNAWDAQANRAGSGAPGGMPEPPAAAAAPARPAPPPQPAGPPANISVATADTSKVSAAHRPIVTSLTNLFNSCTPLANNPVKKREMDDNTKKLGQLLWRLNEGEVSESVIPKLQQLCQAIDAGDWPTANHIQVQMTTTDWEECGLWLSAIKRLIKMRQQMAGQ